MIPRSVLASALAAVMALPAAEALPPSGGHVQAQDILGPLRLAQLRRPGEGGDPTEPGGLPGRSGRSQDGHSMTPRGMIKEHKKAAADKDKDKAKSEARKKKKDQP
jgi:hypothetical protein